MRVVPPRNETIFIRLRSDAPASPTWSRITSLPLCIVMRKVSISDLALTAVIAGLTTLNFSHRCIWNSSLHRASRFVPEQAGHHFEIALLHNLPINGCVFLFRFFHKLCAKGGIGVEPQHLLGQLLSLSWLEKSQRLFCEVVVDGSQPG